jgi:penicillin-binding protein 2
MLVFDQLKKGDTPLWVMTVGVTLGLGTLVAGLWYIQVISANRYRADLRDQSSRIVRLPAIRGKILDRNGFLLAANRPSYNVNLYLEDIRPSFLHEYTNQVRPAYLHTHPGTKLTEPLREMLQREARYRVVSNLTLEVSSLVQRPQTLDEGQFQRHYTNLRSMPFTLLRDLSWQQVALFAEKSSPSSSLALEVQPVRSYPCGFTAAHLIGHIQRDDDPSDDDDISFQFRLPDWVGVMGVEKTFDQQLRGRAGVKSVLVNNLQYRQSEQIWTPPVPGQNVVLTIDLPIQKASEAALRNAEAGTRGAAVVMDCRNGDVLAMASVPEFDPNIFTSRISEEEWEKLSDPELLPQLNRATYGTYPPGSILKIVIAMAGLESDILKTGEVFMANPPYKIDGKGHPWRCTAPAGAYTFDRAFYLSCNCYFIDWGLRIGFERIAEMGRRFGLGQRTGLTTRQETGGYFPDPADKIKADGSRWMPGDTANLCIGQGELRVTPLQMAVMTAAVANGGKVLEPRVVDRIEPPDPGVGGEVIRFPQGQFRQALRVSPRNLEIVRNAMRKDVEERDETGRWGTGHAAAVEGLRVCGKTGTAQLKQGNTTNHITWFVSFAPFDAPRYTVVVMVEGGASGSLTCAPVAQRIYEAIVKREHPPAKGQQTASGTDANNGSITPWTPKPATLAPDHAHDLSLQPAPQLKRKSTIPSKKTLAATDAQPAARRGGT